ncbi:pilus assembly protein TadG-related protein [Salipaludibacillus sp. HK11]|uniref:pilus assembly protein TadG-related protein n=1 Tax=Salipaludibacillus sp. HK11 TaxID=3394320 RepID=UPI0039FD085F
MKVLKNEQGSTLIMIMAILMASIFMAFMFFDLFTTFANKRVSQTGADSGVLAAAKEARHASREALLEEVVDRLEDLEEEIGDLLEDEEEDFLADIDEEEDPPEFDEEEYLENIIDDLDIPDSIVDRLNDPTADIDFEEALDFFFDDDGDVTAIACYGISNEWNEIEEAAIYFAVKNGAVHESNNDIVVRFPYDNEFKIQVFTKRNPDYVTIDKEDVLNNDIFAEAAADVGGIPGFEFMPSRCTGGM